MIPIVESFERTYLGNLDINGRSGSIFAIEDWNFYDVNWDRLQYVVIIVIEKMFRDSTSSW